MAGRTLEEVRPSGHCARCSRPSVCVQGGTLTQQEIRRGEPVAPASAVPAPAGLRARVPEWVRLLLIAPAIGFGAAAYGNHFLGSLPWWRWTGELLAGWVLLILALSREAPPPEP